MVLHSWGNWNEWHIAFSLLNDMFSLKELTVTYEDPDKDKVHPSWSSAATSPTRLTHELRLV